MTWRGILQHTSTVGMKRASSTLLVSIAFSFCLYANAHDSDYQIILNLLSKDKNVRRESAQSLLQSNNPMLIPALVDILFYIPRSNREEVTNVLEKISGENPGGRYYDWVEYVGRRDDLKSPPGYARFKAALLSLIDPAYKKILYTGVPFRIRPEEIVWGGVSLDGIPPIDAPVFLEVSRAELKDDEKVFGLTVRGESRAYPLRYMSWHEILNDIIAGEPITISY